MHVQFFPVYALTCGTHNFELSLSADPRINSSGSDGSLLTEWDLYNEFQAAGALRQPDFKASLRSQIS